MVSVENSSKRIVRRSPLGRASVTAEVDASSPVSPVRRSGGIVQRSGRAKNSQ